MPSTAGAQKFRHELFDKLDEYCAEPSSEESTPFVIVGPPGCGKTTLLAVWLERRVAKQRASTQLHSDEFVFAHVARLSRVWRGARDSFFLSSSSHKEFPVT